MANYVVHARCMAHGIAWKVRNGSLFSVLRVCASAHLEQPPRTAPRDPAPPPLKVAIDTVTESPRSPSMLLLRIFQWLRDRTRSGATVLQQRVWCATPHKMSTQAQVVTSTHTTQRCSVPDHPRATVTSLPRASTAPTPEVPSPPQVPRSTQQR
jgi:hypothetical protein